MRASDIIGYVSGFRMAAECARNALLQKVVDNKADAGIYFHPLCCISTCLHMLGFPF